MLDQQIETLDKTVLLEDLLSQLEGYLEFHDKITETADEGWPTFAQSVRMKALIDNQRILVADDTGVNGKTLTAIGSKLYLDQHYGKRHSAFVVAPNSGMLNAWHEDEIQRYAQRLGFEEQKVVTVETYQDLKKVTEDTDFTIINWEKLQIPEYNSKWINLEKALHAAESSMHGKNKEKNIKQEISEDENSITLSWENIILPEGGRTYNKLKKTLDQVGIKYSISNNEELNKLELHKGSITLPRYDKRWLELEDVIRSNSPDLFVLDECHNAKGKNSLRGKTVQRLNQYSIDKHLLLLSATPIPNRYSDLAMIFHMLDPSKYKSSDMFSYCGPDVMKELLERQLWFRLSREELKEELGLPDFQEKIVPVKLSRNEAEIYFKAWSDCVMLGQGLSELRKILYDANLSKYSASYDQVESSKLKKVSELTDKLTSSGEKVIIKTNFVNGVIDSIADHIKYDKEGNERNVLVVCGDTSQNKRKDNYKLFRDENSGYDVIICSPVIEESIDLTTGEKPCSLISLEPEMTPRGQKQLTGRPYRRGQHGNVTHYNLITESRHLDKLMINCLEKICEEYEVTVPKKFMPRTIDSDMLHMRKAKETIVDKFYEGRKITRSDQSIYDVTQVDKAITHLQGLVAPRNFTNITPFHLATLTQTQWRNLGEEQFSELVRGKGWRKWRNLYEDGWENSASQVTLELIGNLVEDLENRLGYQPMIVDVGSGAAYFSRATGKEVTCVDIDPVFLKRGKKVCEKEGINNDYINATATDTTLNDQCADAVITSYTIFYLGQDDNRSEVEDCILETNRILKDGGEWMISLPYSVDPKCVKRFNESMQEYGFTEKAYITPKRTKCENMKKGCHLLIYQKDENCNEKKGYDLSFYKGRVRFVQ